MQSLGRRRGLGASSAVPNLQSGLSWILKLALAPFGLIFIKTSRTQIFILMHTEHNIKMLLRKQRVQLKYREVKYFLSSLARWGQPQSLRDTLPVRRMCRGPAARSRTSSSSSPPNRRRRRRRRGRRPEGRQRRWRQLGSGEQGGRPKRPTGQSVRSPVGPHCTS